MSKRCAFHECHICDIWTDYEINCVALDEASELYHGNWIEIITLRERIDLLESSLRVAGLPIPPDKI